MAAQWEKVKYISRLRPQLDEVSANETSDIGLQDCHVEIQVNDEHFANTIGKRLSFNEYGEKPMTHLSQPILKAKSYDCVRLSVRDTERQSASARTAPVRRSSSVFSLLNADEIDGDYTKRSQTLDKPKNQRILVKDLFLKHSRHDDEISFDFKVSFSAIMLLLFFSNI